MSVGSDSGQRARGLLDLTFRAKTVIGIALIEAVMLLALVWSGHEQLRQSTSEQIAQRAETTAALFSTLAKDAVIATDLASLETYVAQMMRNPDVHYVRVIGHGTELASSGSLPATNRPDDRAGVELADGVFDASALIVEANHVFGTVQVGLGTGQVDALLASATRRQSTIAGLEIAFVAIFSMVLGTYLTRHLDNLQSGVKALAAGQLGVQIDASGSDELAEVASGFNSMSTRLRDSEEQLRREVAHSRRIAESLRERERALSQHKSQLERRVVQRTRALTRLAEAHAQFIEHANAPIVALDNEMRVTVWNRSAASLTGLAPEAALGQPCSVIFNTPEEDLRRAMRSGRECELRVRTHQGEERLWLMGATARTPIAGGGAGYAFVGRDITERQQMQAQVVQASKLATLGEMATGVAHELNQPLVVMSMAVDNCTRKLDRGRLDDTTLRAKLETVKGQIRRATEIIDHMRIFGRRTDEQPELFRPTSAIENACRMLREQLRLRSITLTNAMNGLEHLAVLGHRTQLEQVILNLLTNARDSILERDGPARSIAVTVRQSECEQVLIHVEDTGGGVPEEVMNRMFEPFYTTKEAGVGTGLGLSISYGIISDMSGSVSVENTDQGARFTVSLPLAATLDRAA